MEEGNPCMIKAVKPTRPITRRKFDETFKREAVHNWLSSGKSAAVIADELGINADRLYLWKKLFAPMATAAAPSAAKPGSMADLQAQLDAARREIRHLHQQRDILKKTLGILSEPPSNATHGSML
jgi:transposase-like protein